MKHIRGGCFFSGHLVGVVCFCVFDELDILLCFTNVKPVKKKTKRRKQVKETKTSFFIIYLSLKSNYFYLVWYHKKARWQW
jgi:hypothetical protein